MIDRKSRRVAIACSAALLLGAIIAAPLPASAVGGAGRGGSALYSRTDGYVTVDNNQFVILYAGNDAGDGGSKLQWTYSSYCTNGQWTEGDYNCRARR